MRKCNFSNGGYVLHKINLPAFESNRYSAWFDESGKMLDCERIDSLERSREVQRDSKAWQMLETIGQRYKNLEPTA